jgi:hypothetical protein
VEVICSTLIGIKDNIYSFLGSDLNIYRVDSINEKEFSKQEFIICQVYWLICKVEQKIIRKVKSIISYDHVNTKEEIEKLILNSE